MDSWLPLRLPAPALLGALLLVLAAPARAAAGPQGPIPTGLPPRLLVGLHEEPGETWMRDSNVPWDVRYRFLHKGWAQDERPGQSGVLQYLRESRAQAALPALVFDQLQGEPGGGEGALYAKTRSTTTARRYFQDFLQLMERAREFGGPVLVIVEPNGTGLLQEQTRGNPGAFAAVAASGLEELAALPDTVAGWGQAFLALRRAAGASNVVLALHVSTWASGEDLTYEALTVPLKPEVEKVVRFLAPLGLGRNPTGQTYELLASSPLEDDSDYYRQQRRAQSGWDPADEASVESRSLNRYVEWLRLFNQRSGKRWVLWQLPPGDSEQLRPGKGDARVRYRDHLFAEGGAQRRERLAEAGVLALLFGRAPDALAKGDGYTAQLRELKALVQPFLEEGGLELPGATAAPVAAAPAPPQAPEPAAPPQERRRPAPAPLKAEESAEAETPPQRPPAPAGKPPARPGGAAPPAAAPGTARAPAPSPAAPGAAAPAPGPAATPTPAQRPAPRTPEPAAGTPAAAPPPAVAPSPRPPALSAATRVSRTQLPPGALSTVSTTVRNDGGAASGLFVELEVFDAAGRRVAQQTWEEQRLGEGESATFAWPWRAPPAPGTYRVRMGLFGAQGRPRYLTQPEAATLTVAAPAARVPAAPDAGATAGAPAGATSGPTAGAPAGSAAGSAAGAVALSLRGDGAQYGFETGTQGWTVRGPSAEPPFVSGAQSYAGARSLGVRFNGEAGTASVQVPAPAVSAGRTVTFHLWVPERSGLDSVQAYVQQGAEGRWRFHGTWRAVRSLQPGAWNTLTVRVPADAASPLLELGVELRARGGWRGTVHLDSVRW